MKLPRVRPLHSIIRVPCNQNSLESATRFAAIRAAIECCAPSQAPDRLIGERMINAGAETLLERPSFKRLMAMRRCLAPAEGFYE
jgi:putative SOS response-associated peptidase YedK